MTSISSNDSIIASAYRNAMPEQFGNLHQRMKWLIETIQRQAESVIPSDVQQAVHELESEIKHHVPAKPPLAMRKSK